jgi:Fic family protein
MSTKTEQEAKEIIAILGQYPEGLRRGKIAEYLKNSLKSKTLQRRLASLVAHGTIKRSGDRRTSRYFLPRLIGTNLGTNYTADKDSEHPVYSEASLEALSYLASPPHSRKIVSYNREFLESYVPNETVYIQKEFREELINSGQRFDKALAAGTYAKQICERLLIDLSYNSSRLEGNTYSLLDTQHLVMEGVTAEGKVHEESVMIMNHKETILFLVENAEEIELNCFTIFNLHNLLSQDLLANPDSCGSIRTIEVNVGKSTYKPLANPHILRESLELLLLKASAIEDPFEQSFFLLIHMSYLQAFEDVNKRTARLASNIPFIKKNLCPLSFIDISQEGYSRAMLLVYEKNNVLPMVELFVYAYKRSCDQYKAAKQSVGEIDAYRVQYRAQRKQVMGQIVAGDLHGKAKEKHILGYCEQNDIPRPEKFVAMTSADLAVLHAGAIVGLGITENQLTDWKSSE